MFLTKSHFYRQAILFVVLGLLSTGCEKDITEKIKINSKPQLIVVGFISPQDTTLIIKVQKTRLAVGYMQDPDQAQIIDARVQLSDGTKTINLYYEANRRIYRAKASVLPIVAGKTYKLTVTTPDGLRANSSCIIPITDGISITTVEHSESIAAPEWSPQQPMKEHRFYFEWQDAPGRSNFYRFFGLQEYSDKNFPQNMFSQPLFNSGEDVYLSDEKKDGIMFTTPIAIFYTEPDDARYRPYTLTAHLAVTDRTYYLYHQSIIKHQNAADNPFAEPVIIYTNIDGGLGVFSGYNQLKARLVVE